MAWINQFESHACLRPMTPSGGVIVRQTPGHANTWINAGHGHKGWGICCATANRVARSMAEADGTVLFDTQPFPEKLIGLLAFDFIACVEWMPPSIQNSISLI